MNPFITNLKAQADKIEERNADRLTYEAAQAKQDAYGKLYRITNDVTDIARKTVDTDRLRFWHFIQLNGNRDIVRKLYNEDHIEFGDWVDFRQAVDTLLSHAPKRYNTMHNLVCGMIVAGTCCVVGGTVGYLLSLIA